MSGVNGQLPIYLESTGKSWNEIFSQAVVNEVSAAEAVANQILGEDPAEGRVQPQIIRIGRVQRDPSPSITICCLGGGRDVHHYHYAPPPPVRMYAGYATAAAPAGAAPAAGETERKRKKEEDNTCLYIALGVIGAVATYFLGQAMSQIQQSNEDLAEIEKFQAETLDPSITAAYSAPRPHPHVNTIKNMVDLHRRIFKVIQRDQYFKFAVAGAVVGGAAAGAAGLALGILVWKVASVTLLTFAAFATILKCGMDSGDKRFVKYAVDLRLVITQIRAVKAVIPLAPPSYDGGLDTTVPPPAYGAPNAHLAPPPHEVGSVPAGGRGGADVVITIDPPSAPPPPPVQPIRSRLPMGDTRVGPGGALIQTVKSAP